MNTFWQFASEWERENPNETVVVVVVVLPWKFCPFIFCDQGKGDTDTWKAVISADMLNIVADSGKGEHTIVRFVDKMNCLDIIKKDFFSKQSEQKKMISTLKGKIQTMIVLVNDEEAIQNTNLHLGIVLIRANVGVHFIHTPAHSHPDTTIHR